MHYPIEDEDKMDLLRRSILLQKEKVPEIKNSLDFYKIKDPINHKYNYQVL
jgi:hypothetical protein